VRESVRGGEPLREGGTLLQVSDFTGEKLELSAGVSGPSLTGHILTRQAPLSAGLKVNRGTGGGEEAPRDIFEFIKAIAKRYPWEARALEALISEKGARFPGLPFKDGLLKLGMELYERFVRTHLDPDIGFIRVPGFSPEELAEAGKRLQVFEEQQITKKENTYALQQWFLANAGREYDKDPIKREVPVLKEETEAVQYLWILRKEAELYNKAFEIGGRRLVSLLFDFLEGKFGQDRISLRKNKEQVEELCEEIREFVEKVIDMAKRYFPKDGKRKHNPRTGEYLSSEEDGRALWFRYARDLLMARWSSSPVSLNYISSRDKKRVVGLVRSLAGRRSIGDYNEAQDTLRQIVEDETEKFKDFYLKLSYEDKALLVHSYFGYFYFRPMRSKSQAGRVCKAFGLGGLFREISINSHKEAGKKYYYLSLGSTSTPGYPIRRGDIIEAHTHPRRYEEENLASLDGLHYDKEFRLYVPSAGDLISDIPDIVTGMTGPLGTKRAWVISEFGLFDVESAVDKETRTVTIIITFYSRPDIDSEVMPTIDDGDKEFAPDSRPVKEIREAITEILEERGVEGAASYDVNILFARNQDFNLGSEEFDKWADDGEGE